MGGYSNVCIKGLFEYYAALSDGVIDGVHSLMFHELITGVSSCGIGGAEGEYQRAANSISG